MTTAVTRSEPRRVPKVGANETAATPWQRRTYRSTCATPPIPPARIVEAMRGVLRTWSSFAWKVPGTRGRVAINT